MTGRKDSRLIARAGTKAAPLLALLFLAGCAPFSTANGGDVLTGDARKEGDYKATWSMGMAAIGQDSAPLNGVGSAPGACAKGAPDTACAETTGQLVKDIQSLLSSLEALPMPPRYQKGDALIRAAFTEYADALALRGKAAPEGGEGTRQASLAKLKEADALLRKGYAAFPADNRPTPSP